MCNSKHWEILQVVVVKLNINDIQISIFNTYTHDRTGYYGNQGKTKQSQKVLFELSSLANRISQLRAPIVKIRNKESPNAKIRNKESTCEGKKKWRKGSK